ncbi:MAG TPA: DUF4333 domain-containing protein [Acidimicrobiia bacterium]|jgi:hypothetical protein
MRVLVAATTLAVAALLVAADGAAAATLHVAPLRREIARQIAATYPGLTSGNVACPERVTRRTGVTSTCTVQLPGTFLFVDVTQTDGSGTVRFESVQALLERSELEQFVAANASLPATVTCGTTDWLVARPGDLVACHAAIADGSQRDVQVVVRDTAGNVTITGVT